MTQVIQIDEIDSAITEILNEYGEETSQDCASTVDEITKETVKIVKENAPVDQRRTSRRGRYKKAIAKKNLEKTPLTVKNAVWAGSEYRLAHLLEFGHQVGSGRAAAHPHFRQGEEYIESNFERKLREKIEK